MAWSCYTDEQMDRFLQDEFGRGYSRGQKDAEDARLRDLQQYIEYLNQRIADQMNLMSRPIYIMPPTQNTPYEAHRDLEARVTKLEQQQTSAEINLLASERHYDKRGDEIVAGMKITSDRVSNLAARVTEVERLKNTKADAVFVARVEHRLDAHIGNIDRHLR